MTSQKRIDANRRNALLSTGPCTEEGKQRSRENAYRHGLTAETVIVGIEDAADYSAFEAEIVADYDPQSVVECELTCRLASLLWRLRRANLIETGLLQIESECGQAYEGPDRERGRGARLPASITRWLGAPAGAGSGGDAVESANVDNPPSDSADRQQTLAHCFLRLTNRRGKIIQRVTRYEASLWRQFLQVLIALDQAKNHRVIALRGRFTRYPPQW
jgi:hypothetical protein